MTFFVEVGEITSGSSELPFFSLGDTVELMLRRGLSSLEVLNNENIPYAD
jgi:hypothetical protein